MSSKVSTSSYIRPLLRKSPLWFQAMLATNHASLWTITTSARLLLNKPGRSSIVRLTPQLTTSLQLDSTVKSSLRRMSSYMQHRDALELRLWCALQPITNPSTTAQPPSVQATSHQARCPKTTGEKETPAYSLTTQRLSESRLCRATSLLQVTPLTVSIGMALSGELRRTLTLTWCAHCTVRNSTSPSRSTKQHFGTTTAAWNCFRLCMMWLTNDEEVWCERIF